MIRCVNIRDQSALDVVQSRVNPIQRHRHDRDGPLSCNVQKKCSTGLNHFSLVIKYIYMYMHRYMFLFSRAISQLTSFVLCYFWFQITEAMNETWVTSQLQFMPLPEDDGVLLKCQADNSALPGQTIEDSLKLDIVCKFSFTECLH